MNKFLILLLTIFLTFTMLTACSNDKNTNPTKPTEEMKQTINILLYEKDINKIKDVYTNKLKEEKINDGYFLLIDDNLGELDGNYQITVINNKFDSIYFKDEIIYNDETINDVGKEFDKIYNSIASELNITIYDTVFAETLTSGTESCESINNIEEFKTLVSQLIDTDDQTTSQFSRINMIGYDKTAEHAIRITFFKGREAIAYQISEMELSH